MHETTRHRLPLLAAGQAQKEITHNEAICAIDRMMHPVAESRGLEVPPVDPARGTGWIIAPSAGGA